MSVLKATFTCNMCDSNGDDCIEIEYIKHLPGTGSKKHTAYVYTTPVGNWHDLKFKESDDVSYSNFLNTMVFKNIDVRRKLAKLALDRIIESEWYRINLLNAIRILDPTFIPPMINLHCHWQCELMEEIATITSLRIIATCRNEKRLERYFNALQALEVWQ